MGYSFSNRSKARLEGVHPDLVAIMHEAIRITKVDFTVLEGLRSVERQKKLVASGASTTLNSRHITGHAVDVAPWIGRRASWHWPHYHELAPYIFKAADNLGIEGLEWGGHWHSFPDGPHWQLSRKKYPS